MYIEFDWTDLVLTADIVMINRMIDKQLVRWATKYNIDYKTKFVKCKYRVTFEDDRYYTLFATTWNPTALQLNPVHPWETSMNQIYQYRLVEPMQ